MTARQIPIDKAIQTTLDRARSEGLEPKVLHLNEADIAELHQLTGNTVSEVDGVPVKWSGTGKSRLYCRHGLARIVTRSTGLRRSAPLRNRKYNPDKPRAAGRSGSRGANGQPVKLMKIGGRTVEIDAEIAPIVQALNEAGVQTVASCSGHGHRPGMIALADGREIVIARDYEEARRIDRLFPFDINGEPIGGPRP